MTSASHKTVPEVFIIETLDPDDEGNGRFEGAILSQILRLHGKTSGYRYVRTISEFEDAVTEFGDSNRRYLHISCHADENGMCTTNQEQIDHEDLQEILTPYLHNKRLFFSACSMVNERLASNLIPDTGCHSIIGPCEDIRFSDAVVFWSSLYHLMFSHNVSAMKAVELRKYLSAISNLFAVDIMYFSSSSSNKKKFKKVKIKKS